MLYPNLQTYIFDGTFYGMMTAIFESYERKHNSVKLISKLQHEPEMFAEIIDVSTDKAKAERVWNGLKSKISKEHQRQYYTSYFSEDMELYQHLFDYAHYIFDHPQGVDHNYGHPSVLAIAQMAQKVHREKHRMEAFIRFKKGNNGLFFAVVSPDFNVLPLIIRHFKNRYADQKWLIYDERRKYGIHFDLHQVEEVTIDFKITNEILETNDVTMDDQEELYTTLWKDYFKSTNIVERKNMKLHIQHVPKRYWRYLTEKEQE